jgi:B12-binding domain/radical SAM domain protein
MLIFYYSRINTYSFNALAGAMDADPLLAGLPIALPTTGEHLRTAVAEAVRHHKRAVIALSTLTCQREEMRWLTGQIRTDFGSRALILAGGAHPTARPGEVLEWGVDYVFLGEAETAFPGALRKILQGHDCAGIGGIAFREGRKVISRPKAPVADLNDFFSFSPSRGMFGPIEMTRGCPFACSYCQTSHLAGASLRHRSVEKIISQAEALRSGNRRVVRLLSPNAFSYGSKDGRQLNLPAMEELLSALRKTLTAKGRIVFGHFPSEVRPEHVTSDTLGLLKEYADNDEIVIGAQSGSQRMLDACHRSHTVESVLAAVSLARKFGYKLIVDFIFGLPGESEADLHETVDLMRKLVRLGARIHAHRFAPLPQTAFSKEQPGSIAPVALRALQEIKEQGGLYQNLRDTIRVGPR